MDACRDGLRQVPQRPRRRRALRRILLWLVVCRQLQRDNGKCIVVQLKLQDVLEAVLGGADDHIREGTGVDSVDVEGGERGRVELPGGLEERVDPAEPDAAAVPEHLQLSVCSCCVTLCARRGKMEDPVYPRRLFVCNDLETLLGDCYSILYTREGGATRYLSCSIPAPFYTWYS